MRMWLAIILGTIFFSTASFADSYAPPSFSTGADLSANPSTATSSPTARTLAARAHDVFNVKDYGALGTGSGTAIGTTYGSSLSAVSAYVAANGSTPFAWMTNSIYGLTFTLNTSAAQGSAGTGLTFQTTLTGINGWSAVSATWATPANGADLMQTGLQVTGSCVPANTTVSSITTATYTAGPGSTPNTQALPTGVITLSQATSTACASGTPITFTLSPTQVGALTYDYLGIQSAYAAAYSNGHGQIYLPAGDYHPIHPVYNPGITNANAQTPAIDTQGAGMLATVISFTTDYGPGVCAMGDSGRGPGSIGYSRYAGFRLSGPGTSNTVGTAVAGMDGLCIGTKAKVDHVQSSAFHAGLNVLEDHQQIEDSNFNNNFYGIYMAPNGDTIGNQKIDSAPAVGNAWSAVAVAWNNSISSSYYRNLDLSNTPYSFYREALPSGQSTEPMSFIAGPGATFVNVFGESIGDGFIYGENSNDVISEATFIGVVPNVVGGSTFTIPGRAIKAVAYVGSWTFNEAISSDFSNYSGNYSVIADSIIEAQNNVQSNHWGDITNGILNHTSGLSYLKAGTVLFNDFKMDRASGEFRTAEAAVSIQQILAYGLNSYNGGARLMASGYAPLGVAAQTVASGAVLPVITQGLAIVNKDSSAITQGVAVCESIVTVTSVTPCSGVSGQALIGTLADAGNVSSGASSAYISIQVSSQTARTKTTLFTTSGTYTRVAGLVSARVRACAGGGGGGGGASQAASTSASGGGSGAGGVCYEHAFTAADMPSSVTVTIGAGGTSGAAAASNGTAGGSGGAGGNTTFGSLMPAVGGGGGGLGGQLAALSNGGGSGAPGPLQGITPTNTTAVGNRGICNVYNAVPVAGAAPGSSMYVSGCAAPGSGTTAVGVAGSGVGAIDSGPSGGAGGGLTASNGGNNGGAGAYGDGGYTGVAFGAAGISGTPNGGAGLAAAEPTSCYSGSSGGGGYGNPTGAGGSGGAGGGFAAGGGGGGSAENGSTPGAGGAGAPGCVLVVESY